MPLTSIYALCETDGKTPRYVGQTSFPLGHRLSNHVSGAKHSGSKNGVSTWINKLLADNQRPIIVLLEECAPEEGNKAEAAWIVLCKQQGCNLLNLSLPPTGDRRHYTSMQIRRDQHEQLVALWLRAINKNQEIISLRDFADRVLVAGLKKLTPIIAPNSVFVEEE